MIQGLGSSLDEEVADRHAGSEDRSSPPRSSPRPCSTPHEKEEPPPAPAA
ncbi:MAG: hypothetical protein U5R31_13105 [Acidimicrobiia bacterium]|nr:hypothetical protein [Acidimicrobiia bacterium]